MKKKKMLEWIKFELVLLEDQVNRNKRKWITRYPTQEYCTDCFEIFDDCICERIEGFRQLRKER